MEIHLSPSPLPLLSPELLQVEASFPPTSVPLPLEAIQSSKEELYTAIQAFAAQDHYAFAVGQSKKITNYI
jgi:hypothetical protein